MSDSFFKGIRFDNTFDTGDGTLILKNVAKAFDMEHRLISSTNNLDKILKEIKRSKKPLFVEVLTDNKQIIYVAYTDY